MKKRLLTLFFVTILTLFPSVCVYAEGIEADKENIDAKEMLEQSEYKEGELIVIFKDNMSNRAINSAVKSEDASCIDIIEVSEDSKASLVEISSEDTMVEAIEKFKDNDKVEYVQPNYKYSFFENDNAVYQGPKYQYHLDNIKAREAWSVIEGHGGYSTTKVAVIDTGVDVLHEDLQDTLVDTEKYYLTVGGNAIPKDYDIGEHGTHVSGIIAASNNNFGVTGVASGSNNDLVDLMVVGSSPDGEYLYTADIIDAINFAKDSGAKVMNMSFGVEGRDRAMEAAIRDAYNSGIVMVAAAGNDGTNAFSSPTDFKEVISVNASNKYDNATYWSDYGTYKDITAPGNNILSTIPGDDYDYMSGTSMASPVVAGVVALMLDANPDLTPAQIYNIICASASLDSFDEMLAYGVVNAKAAVEAAYAASDSVSVTELTIKDDKATVDEGDNVYLETLVRPATSLKSVTWSSDDNSIATVDSVTGKVTGVSAGTTTIRATVDGKEVTCQVTVNGVVHQTSIAILDKEDLEDVSIGFYTTLNVRIMPADATNQEVYYKSSNRKVVDVDEMGYLTAVSAGTVTITVKNFDGSLSDSVDITVHKDARKVNITSRASYWKLLVGEEFTYEAEALDDEDNPLTFNAGVVWSSTDPNVATVNSVTGKVTAKAPGVTYIVATANNPYRDYKVNATSKLTVGKASYSQSDYNLKVTNNSYNSLKLTWNKIPVALSYSIERSTSLNGTYKQIATVTTNSYTNTNLNFNTTYYYRVRAKYKAVPEDIFFGYSYKKGAKTILKAPTLKVSSTKKGIVTLSWGKITGANGYTIYRSTSLNGKYTALKSVTTNSYNNTGLTSGKKYFYKIKAYRTVNGKKVYSSYSNTVNKVVK